MRWEFQRLNDLDLYLDEDAPALQGWRTVSVTRPALHPWADAWWGAGHVLGFEETFVHEVAAFLRHLAGMKDEVATFEDGWRAQRVLDAIEVADRGRRWVDVETVAIRRPAAP